LILKKVCWSQKLYECFVNILTPEHHVLDFLTFGEMMEEWWRIWGVF